MSWTQTRGEEVPSFGVNHVCILKYCRRNQKEEMFIKSCLDIDLKDN